MLVEVLFVTLGLYGITLLCYTLPTTVRNLSSWKLFGSLAFAWNLTSLIAITAATWIAIFAPETKANRLRAKIWLMVLLCCQSILGLLPDEERMAFLIRFFWPGWLAVAALIVLLHIESRLRVSDWSAVSKTIHKRSLFQTLKHGAAKVFDVAIIAIFLTISVVFGSYLTQSIKTQFASRSWPTTEARLIECNTLGSETFDSHHCFDLKYQFDVDYITFTGNDYSMLWDKPHALRFNAAHATVAKIKQRNDLRVAYNPTNPSQSLLSPGIGPDFLLVTCFSCIQLSMFTVTLAVFWRLLKKRRFTEPAHSSVKKNRLLGYKSFVIFVAYWCSIAFLFLAHLVPVSTWLFGALMFTLAVSIACWLKQEYEKIPKTAAGQQTLQERIAALSPRKPGQVSTP